MQESDQRKLGGSAGTIISIAIGLYLQTNPTWGNLHPHLASAFYALACLAFLFAAMQWPLVQRIFGVHHAPSVAPPASSAAHVGAVTIAPVFNNQTNDTVTAPADTPDSLSGLICPRPLLQCSRVQRLKVSYDPFGTWDIDSAGASGIVLYLKNHAADLGEKASIAESAYASVEFSNVRGEVEAHVSKAYWLKEKLCNVSIPIEAEKGILIATLNGLNWHLYDNDRTPQRQAQIQRSRVLPALKDQICIFEFDEPVKITVKVIESWTGETLLKQTFEVRVDEHSFQVFSDL